MKEEVVVISHGDCDGLCSAAITLMKYPQADLIFSQPYALRPVLDWKEIEEAEVVVILDLAFTQECLDKLVEIDKEKTLVYIDHHSSSLQLVGKLKNVMVSLVHSASQLTAIYFQIPTVLAEIGAIGDKILLVSKGCKFFKEAELLRKSLTYIPYDDDFRRGVVHALANGLLPSEIPEVVRRAEESVKIKDKLVKLVEDRIIYNNEFMIVDATDVSEISGRVGIVATELSLRYHKPIFVVSKQQDKFILTGRSKCESGIDLSKVMKFFGGGGHRCAASSSITYDQYKQIVSLLKTAVERCKHDQGCANSSIA